MFCVFINWWNYSLIKRKLTATIYFHRTIYYIWKASVYVRTYVGLLIQKFVFCPVLKCLLIFQSLILLLCFLY